MTASRALVRNFCTQLTKDKYPEVKRGAYSVLTDKHVTLFERILGKDKVLTEDLLSYNQDWMKMVCGYSRLVLKPKTTQEVSEILKLSNKERLAVCPQGGNTGLVGGSVPVFDEIVLSMSLMNRVINIDSIAGTVECESGCVLESLDNALESHCLMMPLDLGAKGSCQIGGNISTSAGGLRLIRYGNLQGNVLGIEAVLADGTIMNCMNTLQKDNTGYHLRQLFIGSEGTLGVVTGAVIKCPPRPNSINLAFLGVESFSDVLKICQYSRKMLSDILSSCEVLDRVCMEAVRDKLGIACPLGPSSQFAFYMVVETHGSHQQHDSEKVNTFLETLMAEGLIADGTSTSQPSHINAIWQVRERITEALLKGNYIYKYDFSLPHKHYYAIVEDLRQRLKGTRATSVSGFGHIADANLHLNITSERFDQELHKILEPYVFEWVKAHGGSISAEHGMGFKKAQFLKYGKSDQAITAMRTIKMALDPNNILNPYKVLPPS